MDIERRYVTNVLLKKTPGAMTEIPLGYRAIGVSGDMLLIEPIETQRSWLMTPGNIIYLAIVAAVLFGIVFAVWKLTPGH